MTSMRSKNDNITHKMTKNYYQGSNKSLLFEIKSKLPIGIHFVIFLDIMTIILKGGKLINWEFRLQAK